MNRKTSLALILLLCISSLSIVGYLPKTLGQSGTFVTGAISSDTTWTQTNSPYYLSGPLTVNSGVTLTIDPGVVVILRTYSIQIDGTLIASGTSSNEAQFTLGQINFASTSNGWNNKTGGGSQFNYVKLATSIQSSVPLKISYCQTNSSIQMGGDSEILDSTSSSGITVSGSCNVLGNTLIASGLTSAVSITGGSSLISNNTIGGGGSAMAYFPSVGVFTVGEVQISQGTAIIQNNTFKGPGPVTVGSSSEVTGNNIGGGVTVSDGSPTIANNIISGAINVNSNQAPVITKNTIYGSLTVGSGSPQITDNYVIGNTRNTGIGVSGGQTGDNVLIAGNYITNSCYGGSFWNSQGSATFQYNQISDCGEGLTLSGGTVTITDNTLQNNSMGVVFCNSLNIDAFDENNIVESQQSIYLYNYTANVDATNNWWGTTNQQAINQTFYDFFNNYDLGIVNFVPFLTAPNPQAPSINSTIPTSTQNLTPSPTPKSTLTSPNPTISPQNPTTGIQTKTGPNICWLEVALSIAVAAVVVLAVTVAVLTRKNGKREK